MASRRRIHLVNVGENNGGDIMMAMAATEALRARLGPLPLIVNGRRPAATPALRVTPHAGASRLGGLLSRLSRRLRRDQDYRPGDVVVDVNGYRHGDIWGMDAMLDDARRAARARAAGAHYILLPKSYGPFTGQAADAFRELVDAASLVYARDRQSLASCVEIGARSEVRHCPDYTIAVAPSAAPAPTAGARPAALYIPNCKLVERGRFASYEQYAGFVGASLAALRRRGYEPAVLFHQSKDVARLSGALLGQGARCHFFDDPRRAKALIGSAALVVSARYHGMISALTQEVPCIVHAWSYKYAGFLDLYEDGQALLVADDSLAALAARLEQLQDGEARAGLQLRLRAGNLAIAAQCQAMWDDIGRLLETGQ